MFTIRVLLPQQHVLVHPLTRLPPAALACPQDVAVVKTQAFGTVLVLDGAIQCTDRDEFSYQVGAALKILFSPYMLQPCGCP